MKNYIILGIVIVALVAYLVLHDANRSQYDLPALPEVAGQDISRIEYTAGGDPVVLTRKADDWFVGQMQWPADAAKVGPMVSTIVDLRLTALVSTAQAYVRYDLTDEKKITVSAWAGDKEVRRFDVGKAADTYRHTFVKLPEDPNVYHAMENFRRTFEHTAQALRDKKVLSVTPEGIRELTLVSADKTLTLTRQEVPVAPVETDGEAPAPGAETESDQPAPPTEIVWQTAAGESVDTDAVKRLLAKFSGMTCESYIDDRKKEALENPETVITLLGDNAYTLSVFAKENTDTGHPAVSSENNYPFILQDRVIEDIRKEMDSLMGHKKES